MFFCSMLSVLKLHLIGLEAVFSCLSSWAGDFGLFSASTSSVFRSVSPFTGVESEKKYKCSFVYSKTKSIFGRKAEGNVEIKRL